MSDNIPFEIQVEIIKRLPVMAVLQFRSVSKTWKSLIDSSEFIRRYNGRQHLFLKYGDHYEQKYISIVDDHTFPQQKVPLTAPLSINMLAQNYVIGSSHGLLCMHCYNQASLVSGRRDAVIWNPSIRKAVSVDVPNVGIGKYSTILGFGVCRETIDPKIVKITCVRIGMDVESIGCIPRQVEVFTLSTGAWRSPRSNLPRTSIIFIHHWVLIDGVYYWLAIDMDDRFRPGNLVISFDMTSEEFEEVSFPDRLLNHYIDGLSLFNLRGSLVVLAYDMGAAGSHVWMMEDGFPKSFTKLFTINFNTIAADASLRYVRGIRKTGEAVLQVKLDPREYPTRIVHEPHSNSITNVGINGSWFSYLYPYMETLLLL